MPDINHLIKIQASPDQVYRALTTAEGIHNWWTRDAVLDSRVGGKGEFRFYGGKSVTSVRIDELEPHARVGWRTLSANAPGGWDGTTITFDLRSEGDGTMLSFAHRGFREANEGYALVNMGWAYYLVSLQQYLEAGQGAPQQDKDFARVIRGAGRPTRDILHNIEIETTANRLYDAITTQEGLAGWWTPRTKAEPRVSALNEFSFEPGTTLTFQVDKLEPVRHVAWSNVQGPLDWQGTRLTFDITPEQDWVNLRFSHSGFASGYELFGTFSYLWAQYIRSLKLFLETGKGEPFGSPASKAAGTTPR